MPSADLYLDLHEVRRVVRAALEEDGAFRDVTTLGLNWYLNAYLKAQLNYIHSHTTNNSGLVALTNLFDIRVQMDF